MESLICLDCSQNTPVAQLVKCQESSTGYRPLCLACRRVRKAGDRERGKQRIAERGGPRAEGEKQCTHCQVVKPRLNFSPHATAGDGRNSWCKACGTAQTGAYRKLRRATDPAFREALAARKREDRRATDPGLADRDARRADCKAHVAVWCAWLKALAAADAHVLAYRADLKRQTPFTDTFEYHFARAYERCKSSIRRARRKGGRVAGVGLKQLLPYYLRAVQLERRTGISWDVDHTCAYADGGKHEPANLQILPRVMNEAKGARSATIPLGVPTHQELEDAWLL